MSTDLTLSRLQSGWRPGQRELGSAEVLDQWRLHPPGPYVLQGQVGDRVISGVAVAFNAAAGWAHLADRWFMLGTRATGPQLVVFNEDIMRSAAEAFADPHVDAQSVAVHARELARRASGVGLIMPAYLLNLAAETLERVE